MNRFIRRRVADPQAILAELAREHREAPRVSHMDGLLVRYDDWWFNMRPSNTEPLLRLNVEAKSEARMQRERDRLLEDGVNGAGGRATENPEEFLGASEQRRGERVEQYVHDGAQRRGVEPAQVRMGRDVGPVVGDDRALREEPKAREGRVRP